MDPDLPIHQTPVDEPYPAGPLEPPKIFPFKWIVIVLVVALIICIPIVYFFGQESALKLTKKLHALKTSKTTVSSPTPASNAADATADWKTYNGTGFSIKYPITFTPENTQWGVVLTKGKIQYSATSNGGITLQMAPSKKETIQIDGISGEKWTYLTSDGKISGIYYVLTKNSDKYTIGYSLNGDFFHTAIPSEDTAVLDQITNTFKFTDQASEAANDPTKVVNDFYSTYVDCYQKYYDAIDKGTSPTPTSCPSFSTYPTLNPDLISKLNQVRGADPILCAQNIPASIKVDNAVISGNAASATVHTYYTSSGDNPIKVDLIKQNNNWLITNITCNNHQN